jgi:hypothetical protein
VRPLDNRPIQLETFNPDFSTRRQNITLRNPVEDESSQTRANYGFIFGGPLIRKSNFLLSYERQQINASREANFAVPTVAQRGLLVLVIRDSEWARRRGNHWQCSRLPPRAISSSACFRFQTTHAVRTVRTP